MVSNKTRKRFIAILFILSETLQKDVAKNIQKRMCYRTKSALNWEKLY